MMSDEQFYMCRNRSIVVALTLLLAGCNNQQTPTHRLPAPEVTVSEPEQKEGVNWNEFTGRTAAGKLVNVTPGSAVTLSISPLRQHQRSVLQYRRPSKAH